MSMIPKEYAEVLFKDGYADRDEYDLHEATKTYLNLHRLGFLLCHVNASGNTVSHVYTHSEALGDLARLVYGYETEPELLRWKVNPKTHQLLATLKGYERASEYLAPDSLPPRLFGTPIREVLSLPDRFVGLDKFNYTFENLSVVVAERRDRLFRQKWPLRGLKLRMEWR